MDKLLYFSYGSNMSSPRLMHRVSSAQSYTTACLQGHRLKFHKRSHDGSAKCDIEHTQDHNDIVYGVVFSIRASEKKILDRYEGLGNGYEEKHVSIIMPGDKALYAFAYYATHIDTLLQPYHWYKEHVIRGAREHNLPGQYIESIESIASVPDPDPYNHIKELSIYSTLEEKTAF